MQRPHITIVDKGKRPFCIAKREECMKKYYQDSLQHLRTLGSRFAEAHPTIAPLLNSQSADPDVERLLEGTAFLCGLIEERLDQNFPEVIYSLLEIVAPELLHAIPSQTLIQFTPAAQMHGGQLAKAGTELHSIPVQGAVCPFSLMQDTFILPILSSQTHFESLSEQKGILRWQCSSAAPIASWLGKKLSLYVNGPFPTASLWHKYLLHNCTHIEILLSGRQIHLPASALRFTLPPLSPFAHIQKESLTDFAYLRDYFSFPEKYLFIHLHKLENILQATDSQTTMEIRFHLHNLKGTIPQAANHLLLANVATAMNVFKHAATPFPITHTKQDYALVPEEDNKKSMSIYAVQEVVGVRRGGQMRNYSPFSTYKWQEKKDLTYSLRRIKPIISGRYEHYIGFLHESQDELLHDETLTAQLLCYQHILPTHLLAGDIHVPTDSSPAMASFTNIIKPTMPTPPPDNPHLLWQLFSHIHANLLPLSSAKALQECLLLYSPHEVSDATQHILNKKRIESIENFQSVPTERLYKGRIIRGQKLLLVMNSDGFASLGEMHLFGMILEQVFLHYAPINSYIQLHIQDTVTGEVFSWAPKLGSKVLL